jgi:hypothetical protein
MGLRAAWGIGDGSVPLFIRCPPRRREQTPGGHTFELPLEGHRL